MANQLLVAHEETTAVTSHTLTFGTPTTAGREVFVVGVCAAVVSLPAGGWVFDKTFIDAVHQFVLRLPGASNPGGLTSLALSTPQARRLTAVAWETDEASGAPTYGDANDDGANDGFKFTNPSAPVSAGTLWGTGLHTFASDYGVAVLWGGQSGTNPDASQAVSVDQGTLIGSAHSPFGGTADEGGIVAVAITGPQSNNGVTATLSPALDPNGFAALQELNGFLGYDAPAPGLSVASINPADGASAVATTSTVQVTFNATPLTASIVVTHAGGTIAGSTSGTGATRTFTPSAPLPSNTVFTVTVNATDANGSMTPFVSQFDTNPPPAITPPTVLKAYSGGVSLQHTIILDQPSTPGLDMLAFCIAPATISTPVGWTKIYDSATGDDRKCIFRLDGADNSGISQVPTMTLNGARGLAAVVVEGLFESPATDTLLTGGTAGPSGTLWSTGSRTVDEDHVFAVLWASGIGGTIGALNSFDNGFSLLGSGRSGAGSSGNEHSALSLGYASAKALAAAAVVGTLASNTMTTYGTGGTSGVVTFAQRAQSGDTFPPVVQSVTPASPVSLTPTFTVTFSESVEAGGTITLTGPGGAVAATVAGTGATRTITPDAPLAYGTTYTISVSGWQDASGNLQASTYTTTRTTIAAPDTTPPVTVTQSPAPNGTDVDVSTSVSIRFDEGLGGGYAMTVTPQGGGGAVAGLTTYSPGNFSLTFTPTNPLAYSTVYDVSVTGIQDSSGNAAADVSWSFTTAAQGAVGWGATLVDEIALPGEDSTQWAIAGAGAVASVAGFARQMSVNAGSTIDFAVDGTGCTVVDIYRIGGYDTGWRKVGSVANTPTDQPAAQEIANSGPNGNGTECSNWSTTASWAVPAAAWSGLYVALARISGNGFWIPFVVRNDSRTPAIILKTSDTTWGAAYNYYGTPGAELTGRNLYGTGGGFGNVGDRTYKASFDRPIVTRDAVPQTYWLNAEAPLIRFLEKQGFDYKMITCGDLDAGGVGALAGAQVMISSGHDEYWSQGMRDAATAWRDQGGHLIFMSGNEVFWRIEFSPDRRTVICYKDSIGSALINPSGEWTGTWRDADWANVDPEYNLTGTYFRMNGVREYPLQVSAALYAALPFWRGTSVAAGTDLTVNDIIGFEADDARPTLAAAVKAADSSIVLPAGVYATDDGVTYTGGTMNWGIQIQQADSLGVVVGFGTCQWAWGLDPVHDRGSNVENVAMKQATINLLTDMGAVARRPTTGLTAPSPVGWADYGLIGGSSGGGGVVIPPSSEGNLLYISDGTRWIRVV